MPLPVAWSDGTAAGTETEMTSFRAHVASKPQAWLPQQLNHQQQTNAASLDKSTDGEWMGRPQSAAPAIITVSRTAPSYSLAASVLVSAPAPTIIPSSTAVPATAAATSPAPTALTPRSAIRSVTFLPQPAFRRSPRRPSGNLSAATPLNQQQPSEAAGRERDGHSNKPVQPAQPAATSTQQQQQQSQSATSASSSSSSSSSFSLPSSSAYCDTLDGYTVIDIRSLPPSLSSSPQHSPMASPAPQPPRRAQKTLHVDTAQLMQAAEEEDVSPRTALFLAMKQKAKAEKKKAKKDKEKKERSDRDKDKDKEKEKDKEKQSSGNVATSSRQPPQMSHPQPQPQQPGQQAAASKRHTLQPYSSSSVSSSLHSLSLSSELSSLSASLSMSQSPRSSLSRSSSLDDDRRDERRLKKDERRRLGYKLCKVSGCMEARGRDEDGQHYKYCKAHLGIHTLNNPNSRKKSQRDIT